MKPSRKCNSNEAQALFPSTPTPPPHQHLRPHTHSHTYTYTHARARARGTKQMPGNDKDQTVKDKALAALMGRLSLSVG